VGEQQRSPPASRRRQRGLGPGMAAPDDDDIEMFLELHVL
jgi:hypothetical protein